MLIHNHKVGNWLGFLSVFLAVVAIVYIFHPDAFPNHALTETVVLLGAVGGSLLAALSPGLAGSRWWLAATLAAAVDVACLRGFSP